MKTPIKLTRKKKWIVASCPVLDVHSQGRTEGEAKDNLEEAIDLFFAFYNGGCKHGYTNAHREIQSGMKPSGSKR